MISLHSLNAKAVVKHAPAEARQHDVRLVKPCENDGPLSIAATSALPKPAAPAADSLEPFAAAISLEQPGNESNAALADKQRHEPPMAPTTEEQSRTR